jgi:DNA-directed RNA polymerase II subunit RPB1
MNLTYPEVVNRYNLNDLRKLVLNGPDVYPGAKYVRQMRPKMRTIRLKNIDRSTINLEEGDVVERHLRNGDVVLFNRQPSLHKMSMMAHRVRVMPYNTFRLNVCVTPSFNADFDGDEMNMHVPQSIQTHEELRELAAVPTQIISPRQSKPIISIVQDITLGVYRMTKEHVRVPLKQYFNIISTNPRFLGEISTPADNENRLWTGKQLLSMLIPKGINVHTSNSFETGDKEHQVIIKNGQLLQGIVDKGIYQSQTKGLVHAVYNEYGSDETRRLFDNTQRFVCDWLVYNGFSVGISDLIVNDKTISSFHEIINKMRSDVFSIMERIHKGNFENLSTKNNAEYFEQEVNNILNKTNGDVGTKALSKLNDLNNRLINMIRSQSKGNSINVAQMIGCLGSTERRRQAYSVWI